ncbi:Cobalamin synthase [Roseovarius sp. THAF27]|uniref:adenosylcobinamide-GDP ribazoletransferase n=1 Tax=Roseovarius sp. THAF27 TaxID=2587850 RepID=UPI00126899BB|nr:adenosylcobinamide-GDP ribazoletransferase [Roseovarius sp. THAF27]QFT82381.1 Cobalamin synthase [Roseovarius sp. THAF27]
MSLRARVAEFQLAVMLLTRLPAGRIGDDPPTMLAARWAFVPVGALVGALTWLVFSVAEASGASEQISALLALGAMALVTGALHFDGLADFADGHGGGHDKAHALEIMRDSRIGSYGVVAVGVAAALWAVSVAEADAGFWTFVGAAMLSRAAMVAVQESLLPARADGLGRSAAGRSKAARGVLVAAAVVALVFSPWALLACALVTFAIGWLAWRKIGGQTGDVLGAVQLVSETAIWVALACL